MSMLLHLLQLHDMYGHVLARMIFLWYLQNAGGWSASDIVYGCFDKKCGPPALSAAPSTGVASIQCRRTDNRNGTCIRAGPG